MTTIAEATRITQEFSDFYMVDAIVYWTMKTFFVVGFVGFFALVGAAMSFSFERRRKERAEEREALKRIADALEGSAK